MTREERRRAYIRALDGIARRQGRLERESVLAMLQFLRALRDRVGVALLAADGGSAFDEFRLQEFMRSLDGLVGEFERDAVAAVRSGMEEAARLGQAWVVEPLDAAGIGNVFFAPSPAQVNVLVDFSAEMIRDVAKEARQKISRAVRLGAVGESRTLDVMRDVTRILGIPGKKKKMLVKGISARAEMIVRTEQARIFSLSSHSQMVATARDVPDLGKGWMATGDGRTRGEHLDAHGQVVGVDEPFIVGGEALMYPLDPRGSAGNTIRCRCRGVAVHPEIGWIGTPVDEVIEDERRNRGGRRQARPRQLEPSGVAVSNALKIGTLPSARSKSGKAARAAIAAIDAVHGDGALPTIAVDKSAGKRTVGSYWRDGRGNPMKITVSTRGDHPALTTAHEIGHFLDHAGIGDRNGFASENDERFAAWRKVVKESAAYKSLQDAKGKRFDVDVDGRSLTYTPDRKWINYTLTGRELWARSYAQYVATVSNDPLMMAELDAEREGIGRFLTTQWDDDDFRPIAAAIDDLFEVLEWRVNK